MREGSREGGPGRGCTGAKAWGAGPKEVWGIREKDGGAGTPVVKGTMVGQGQGELCSPLCEAEPGPAMT